jgi:hypothetical protein
MSNRSKMIRKAASLPKGSPKRREILASLQKQSGGVDDHILPPGIDWDKVARLFNEAHNKWYDGLREYQDVMETIEGYAKLAGRDYKEVVDLARRGQNTARGLLNQQNAIQDDLYAMLNRMPWKD